MPKWKLYLSISPSYQESGPEKHIVLDDYTSGEISNHQTRGGFLKNPIGPLVLKHQVGSIAICKELKAVVVHHGRTISNGHYTIFVRKSNSTLWFNVDDDIISVVESAEVIRQSKRDAYLVLYGGIAEHQ